MAYMVYLYMHFFLAFDLFPLALPPDEDEFIETLEVSFTEAEAMIQTGQIIDAKTALGIVLAAAWLKQRGDRPEG